jgi:hypothetical protein
MAAGVKRTITILFYLFVFLANGCVVFSPVASGPAEREETSPEAGAGVPEPDAGTAPAKWAVRDIPQLTAVVEFADEDAEGAVEYGVSFFNTIKAPKTAAAVLLAAGGELYPLDGIRTVFAESETRELRISAVLPRKSLLAVLQAETVYLVAVIDRIEYQFEPGKDFTAYKHRVLERMEAGGD